MVRNNQRTTSTFTLCDKALDLAVYTTNILANDKVFDPKFSRVIDRIEAEATLIYNYIRVANDIAVRSTEDGRKAEERLRLQYEALNNIEPLKSDIMIAHKLFHLSGKRVRFWTNQVNEVKDLLNGWIKSDKKRYKELGL